MQVVSSVGSTELTELASSATPTKVPRSTFGAVVAASVDRTLANAIAGSGARLYDGIDTTYLKLVALDRLKNGVIGLTYVLR